jgi:hypothetical protein
MTDQTAEMDCCFDDLRTLIADMEAGKPFDAPPEILDLARMAAQIKRKPLNELSEEEAIEWARRVVHLVVEGDDK